MLRWVPEFEAAVTAHRTEAVTTAGQPAARDRDAGHGQGATISVVSGALQALARKQSVTVLMLRRIRSSLSRFQPEFKYERQHDPVEMLHTLIEAVIADSEGVDAMSPAQRGERRALLLSGVTAVDIDDVILAQLGNSLTAGLFTVCLLLIVSLLAV